MFELILMSTLILWAAFAIVFPIYKKHMNATGLRKVALTALVSIFLVLDVVYNAIIGSILFLEPPTGRKFLLVETFSERVDETYDFYSKFNRGHWRFKLSGFFRRIILRTDPEHFA